MANTDSDIDSSAARPDSSNMNLTQDDLDAAVDAGALDARARDRLLAFLSARGEGAVQSREGGPDNESFRLLTGFNDIFVSLACILLLVAVGSLVPQMLAPFGIAATSWGLAEYFTRQRRMALPSIILLLAFVGSIFAGVLVLMQATPFQLGPGPGFAAPIGLAPAGAAAVAAATAHWFRFRVPITMAAGAAGLVALASGVMFRVSSNPSILLVSMLLGGLAIFAFAMRYDMKDRERITRNTDIAFWLHLLAAPLIVHPIFSLTGLTSQTPAPGAAIMVMLVYATLTIVALAIDRRAVLVSALVYVLWALNGLFAAGQVAAGFGLTALVLGSFLVILSAAWGGLRRRLLAFLPPAMLPRLPPAG